MDYLENLDLIKRLGTEILKPRSYCYSQQMVAEYLRQYRDIDYEPLNITNESGENLKASLFVRGQPTDLCLVFMHGLGSTRLEGLNLLKEMPLGYSLCVFDFSGSGKSEGNCVTYGIKEKHDIQSVLNMLRSRYSRFVLWGRSMGAVSALLYAINYKNPDDVILLILDSPFSSFEVITKELALRRVKVPGFMIGILLDLVKSNFKRLDNDPFQIDVSDCSSCRIPALFIYSQSDDVVSAEHTLKIIGNYKAKYDRYIIKQSHNAPRSRDTLKKIFGAIEQTHTTQTNKVNTSQSFNLRRRSIFESRQLSSSKRGINVMSRQKSTKDISRKQSLQKQTLPVKLTKKTSSNLHNMEYFAKSTELHRQDSRKPYSPRRKYPGDFYSSFEDQIAYSLTEKITQKMMLSNQRYL